jgi:hypothetical protein
VRAICGIDWASDWHDVHVSDEFGGVLAAEQFSHDEYGIGALIGLLLEHRVEVCAIERPDGLLVGRLLAAGISILAIHRTSSRPPRPLPRRRGRWLRRLRARELAAPTPPPRLLEPTG